MKTFSAHQNYDENLNLLEKHKEYKDEPLYVNPARVAIPFYEKLG